MNESPESPPSGGRIVVFVVALVAVVGLAFWLLDLGSIGSRDAAGEERPEPTRGVDPSVSVPDANRAAVGDCVAVVKSGVDAELDLVECGTAEARYTVAHDDVKQTESCPAGPFLEYSRIGLGGFTLCLMLNAAVGECFTHNLADGYVLADCAAADVRVTAVLPEVADAAACPAQPADRLRTAEPLVYPEPPVTICMESTR